jgi:hypothetical protein
MMWDVLECALDHFGLAAEEFRTFGEWAFANFVAVLSVECAVRDLSFAMALFALGELCRLWRFVWIAHRNQFRWH